MQVLLDSRHRADINDVAALLQAADIPTRTYAPPGGIDHNKVIVVDETTVITGSFNFTEHARANAENLHIDRDMDDAARYVADGSGARRTPTRSRWRMRPRRRRKRPKLWQRP